MSDVDQPVSLDHREEKSQSSDGALCGSVSSHVVSYTHHHPVYTSYVCTHIYSDIVPKMPVGPTRLMAVRPTGTFC